MGYRVDLDARNNPRASSGHVRPTTREKGLTHLAPLEPGLPTTSNTSVNDDPPFRSQIGPSRGSVRPRT